MKLINLASKVTWRSKYQCNGAAKFFLVYKGAVNQKRLRNIGLGGPFRSENQSTELIYTYYTGIKESANNT